MFLAFPIGLKSQKMKSPKILEKGGSGEVKTESNNNKSEKSDLSKNDCLFLAPTSYGSYR